MEKDIQSILKEYGEVLSKNVFSIMKAQSLSVSEIIQKGKKMGISISSGNISNITSGNSRATLATLIKLSSILDVSISDLICNTEKDSSSITKDNDFITDINSKFFQPYLGEYHVYFFPTEEINQDKLLHGLLKIGDFKDKGTLKFTLDVNVNEANTKKSIKEYYGRVILSQPIESIYCILEGIQQVEYCFLALNYQYLITKELKNRIALALTVSSGNERRPTIHRVYLTRDEISEKEKQLIMGVLRLNSSEIMIPVGKFDEIIRNDMFSDEFVNYLKNNKKEKSYYSIDIKEILNDTIDLDMVREILILSNYAFSHKFHKVLKIEDDLLYKLFYTYQKNE